MSNPVFDTARATLDHALKMIEGEHERIKAVADEAAATQTRIDALRKNEADLNALVSDLAQQVAKARKMIADADGTARDIINTARAQANDIAGRAQQGSAASDRAAKEMVAIATQQAAGLVARANEQAGEIVFNAQKEAEHVVAQATSDVRSVKEQIDAANETLAAISRQCAVERGRLADIKKSAAEFAKQ